MARNKEKPKSVLTRREAGVFKLFYLDGKTYREIAVKLWISTSTVASHLYHARTKLRRLGLSSRAEFMLWARESLMSFGGLAA